MAKAIKCPFAVGDIVTHYWEPSRKDPCGEHVCFRLVEWNPLITLWGSGAFKAQNLDIDSKKGFACWLRWEPKHPDRLIAGTQNLVWERWDSAVFKSQPSVSTLGLN